MRTLHITSATIVLRQTWDRLGEREIKLGQGKIIIDEFGVLYKGMTGNGQQSIYVLNANIDFILFDEDEGMPRL